MPANEGKDKLLCSVSSYGTANLSNGVAESQHSSHSSVVESDAEGSLWPYHESDLISTEGDPLVTISEVKREITKAKRCAIVTIIATVVLTVLSVIGSENSGSTAAFGFAFESLLAGIGSFIILWRFSSLKEPEPRQRRREVIALFIITLSLIASGISVGYKSIKALVCSEKQEKSRLLLTVSIISVLVYLTLFVLEYRIAKKLCSRALRADAIDALCAAFLALSIVVTTGTREFTTKAWFMDSIIALGVALFSFFYGLYCMAQFVRLYKRYRKDMKSEQLANGNTGDIIHPPCAEVSEANNNNNLI